MFTDLMGNKATQEADKENSSGVYICLYKIILEVLCLSLNKVDLMFTHFLGIITRQDIVEEIRMCIFIENIFLNLCLLQIMFSCSLFVHESKWNL